MNIKIKESTEELISNRTLFLALFISLVIGGLLDLIAYFFRDVLPDIITFFLIHAAITFFILALIILIFEVFLRNETNKKVKRIFEKEIDTLERRFYNLENYTRETISKFDILKLADEGKILSIFPDRSLGKDSIAYYLNYSQLEETAKLAKLNQIQIDMLGITLRDFFTPGRILSKKMANFFTQLHQIDEWIKNKEIEEDERIKIDFRIMILYPFSNSATVRMIREELARKEDYTKKDIVNLLNNKNKTRLYQDSLETLKTLNFWANKFKNSQFVKLQIKLCTLNPMVYILRFNNIMYQESYHLGLETSYNQKFPAQVFMVKISQGESNSTKAFDVFKNHFEYIWNHTTTLGMADVIKQDEIVNLIIMPDNLENQIKKDIEPNITIPEFFQKSEINN